MIDSNQYFVHQTMVMLSRRDGLGFVDVVVRGPRRPPAGT